MPQPFHHRHPHRRDLVLQPPDPLLPRPWVLGGQISLPSLLPEHGAQNLGREFAILWLLRLQLLLELRNDVEEQGRDGTVDLLDKRVRAHKARRERRLARTLLRVLLALVRFARASDRARDDFGKVLADVSLEPVGRGGADVHCETVGRRLVLHVFGEELGEKSVDDFVRNRLELVENLAEDAGDANFDVLRAVGAAKSG